MNRLALPALFLFLPSFAFADTFVPSPSLSIGIDTFGLPSSLTILEGEKPKEDLEVKKTSRFLLIEASNAFYNGDMVEALARIEDGLRKGYYTLHFKRLLSRVHFMDGRLDSALAVAREVAEDTDAVVDDGHRHGFLETVDRYLKISLDTQSLAYGVAATVNGDQKSQKRFITPVGVEVDKFGRILQTSFGTDEVIVLSKGLEFEMKLSGISNPFDVTVDPDGAIYVTSFGSDKIHRFKQDGSSLGSFGKKGRGPGEFFGPEGIVISPDRYIYAVDGGNHRVQKFSLDGNFLMTFGGRGIRPGQFLSPRAIAVDRAPGSDDYTLLVMSQEGQLLQRFDRYGNFLGVLPTPGLEAPRDFDWLGDRGLLFCTARGELISQEHGIDTMMRLTDEFGQPLVIADVSGLAVDQEAGLIYAASQTSSELRVLQPGSLAKKTLLNITDVDFAHYPYIGVTVQVTTGRGEPITGLSRRNFAVEEDNHRVVPVSLQPMTQTGPLNLIVHLDPSSSLDRRTILIRSFLSDLTRELPPNFVLSIRKGHREILPPTDNPYFIRKSLDRIGELTPGSLSKDIHESLNALMGSRGRRNLLIVTSRDEDLSADQFAPLFLHLINQGISLFVLHIGDRHLPVLRALSFRTGGDYRRLKETSIAGMAFELAASKTATYFLVYASPYGELQTNIAVDMTLRLFYLSDAVSDRIRYYAPRRKEAAHE